MPAAAWGFVLQFLGIFNIVHLDESFSSITIEGDVPERNINIENPFFCLKAAFLNSASKIFTSIVLEGKSSYILVLCTTNMLSGQYILDI